MAGKAKPEDGALYDPSKDLEAWGEQEGVEGGEGLEDTGDIQVQPFLQIVQGNSQILKPNSEVFNDDARQGMMVNSATGRLYDESVEFLVCHLYSCYTLWGPDGTSFKGLYAKDAPEVKRAKRSGLRMLDEETGGNFGLTFRMDGMVINKEEDWPEYGPFDLATISLNSKGLTGGKRWVSRMRMLKFKDKNGVKRTLPLFGATWTQTTWQDKNEFGEFYLFRHQPGRVLNPNSEFDAQLIEAAKTAIPFYTDLKDQHLSRAQDDDVPF